MKHFQRPKSRCTRNAAACNETSKRDATVLSFSGEGFSPHVKAYQGDGLSFISLPEQVTRNVKFDGKDYPQGGRNAGPGSTSSIRRGDEYTLEMTDKSGGKVTNTREIGIAPDGKTLTMTVHTPGRKEPDVLVFDRG
jgi:hypothetical protein